MIFLSFIEGVVSVLCLEVLSGFFRNYKLSGKVKSFLNFKFWVVF